MKFPETQRIIYTKSPLEEVICQLRFPPILQIEKEIPFDFQEKIRFLFPEFVEGEEVTIPLPKSNLEDTPPVFFELAKNTIKRKNFTFLSEDKKWKINLSRDFIALSTVNYTQWEIFLEKFRPVFENFSTIYKPVFISRIGLRYRDVIRRSLLDLTTNPWSELLQPAIIGFLGDNSFQESIDEFVSNTILDIDENSKVRIQTGFINYAETLEKGFVIDSDFYTIDNFKIADVSSVLDKFHDCASRLIRWCITEKLHNAMDPKKL